MVEAQDVTAGPDREAVPDYASRARLDGRVFAVFGAGRGIGRQCAHALRQAGADLVCVDRDAEAGEAVAGQVGGTAVAADMTDENAVIATLEKIRRSHGRLDGIVDIIGGSLGTPLLAATAELVRRNFDLNLFQAMSVVRHGAAAMTAGGTIVLVGSVAGMASLPDQALYGTAKAALHHFVRCAAAELGHRGVRVNAVAPGYVRTERMLERFDEDFWEEIAANTPVQRGGETADIAGAALFLSQDLSAFVTGQVLVADGGLLAPARVMQASSARQIAGRASGN